MAESMKKEDLLSFLEEDYSPKTMDEWASSLKEKTISYGYYTGSEADDKEMAKIVVRPSRGVKITLKVEIEH